MKPQVRREGPRLVDGDGRPVIMRGMGIGNWLLPEGYMWQIHDGATSPRRIEAMVTSLVGEEEATRFWQRFRASFFTSADVARIAAAGFDHVRLPFNARHLIGADGTDLAAGWTPIDDCIAWCADAGLGVVLDLHAAPGGQTGANIDDSEGDEPGLFLDPGNRELCVELWRRVAMRYADEPAVWAYDLLNEPLRDEYATRHADDLRGHYQDLTAAIRSVDEDHLVMYEGAHWATDLSIIDRVWDEASVLQFHRYWAPPEVRGFRPYLDLRDRLGLPLYLGESGENSAPWVRASFGLAEELGIGWCFWHWKKLATTSSPADMCAPEGWSELVAYAEGRGRAPSPARAAELLEGLLEAMPISRCTWRQDIVDALMQWPAGEVAGYGFVPTGRALSHPESDGLRSDEGLLITQAEGEAGAYVFAPDPAERARAGELVVRLRTGDEVAYRCRGARPEVELVGAAGGVPEIAVRADGDSWLVVVRATSEVSYTGLVLTTALDAASTGRQTHHLW